MISVGKFIRYVESSKLFLVHHFLMNKNPLPKDLSFFIKIYPKQYIPYFIDCAISKEEGVLELKIQESFSMQVSKEVFLQKEFFLEEKEFLKYAGFYSPLRYLGCQVFDKNNQCIGTFQSIFEYQSKWCLRICNLKNEEMFVYLSNKKLEEVFKINTTERILILL